MSDKARVLLDKKENVSLKKLNSCKKTKCAKLYRRKLRASKKFDKEQEISCSKIRSDKKYYNCTEKFYDSSSYKNIFDEYAECVRTKCKKEKLKHIQTFNNIVKYDMEHNINPLNKN